MSFAVHLCADAESDLERIRDRAAARQSTEAADALLAGIEEAVMALGELPQRGSRPPELERVGVLDYRELLVGPYRVIYRVEGRGDGQSVVVRCVIDSRRELQELLWQRLLR